MGRAHRRPSLEDLERDEYRPTTNRVLFRSRHGSLVVQAARVATAHDALRELVACLFELVERAGGNPSFSEQDIGFLLGTRMGGATRAGAFSGLSAPEGTSPSAELRFYGQPYDAGFGRLLGELIAVCHHDPVGAAILRRRGVTPLLR